MNDRKYCVYKHTSPNGKVYIGVTSQRLKHRFNNGKGYFHNEHFKRAILLYGWKNIKHEVLISGLTREEAICEEKHSIAFYESTDYNKGYNLMTGGDGIGTHTQETREKLRKISTGKKWTEEQKKKYIASKTGFRHSDATKEKLREQRTGENNPYFGKHHTEEEKAKVRANMPDRKGGKSNLARAVIQYSTSGEFIKEYPAISVAGKENGIVNYYNICQCCRGRLKTSYGFIWRYADEQERVST